MMVPIAAWLLAINAVTHAAFAIDKARALAGGLGVFWAMR